MAGARFYLFLAALCSCSMLGFGDSVAPELKTETIDVVPAVPISVAPHEVTGDKAEPTTNDDVKPVPTTTVPPTPPPTTPPTTTPPTTPPTTTSSSTTQSTTTTSTTPAPTTTTPAPKPKPLPAPDQGTWMYTDVSTNTTCILTQFAAQITLTYSQTVSNKTVLANVTMNVPANATVLSGDCNATATDQWMTIGWLSEGSSAPVTLLMLYRKNDTTKSYALNAFNLTVDATLLVNSSVKADTIVLSHGEEWTTPLATSYRCMAATQLSMSNDTYSTTATVAVSRLQEEAFRTSQGKGFSVPRECGSGDVPDAVPIAVGCALGGLVLVVLVAYLAARARSTARGYLSM